MSEYFMLECVAPDDWEDNALIPGLPPPPGEDSWRFGQRFAHPPHEPIEIELDPEYGVQIPELDNVDSLLLTKRLHAAMVEGGVSNLDAYRTTIRHIKRGFVTTDYLACNVVGIVSAVDLGLSSISGGSADGLIDVDFESVVIDPSRVSGLLLFRLVENTSAIVVHRRLKEYLLSRGFDQLMFVAPEDWIG